MALVGDLAGKPSDDVLVRADLSLRRSPAEVHAVDCNGIVPPGRLWLVVRAGGEPASFVNLHMASDEVAPRGGLLGESLDGGKTWNVSEARRGPGYAVRISAEYP